MYNTKTLVEASDTATKIGMTNHIDSKPVRPTVQSEQELESLDVSRHQEYKLYWHF
jgi:hypothetical protein